MGVTKKSNMHELPYLMGDGGDNYNDEFKKLKLVKLEENELSKHINDFLNYREISSGKDKLDFSTDLPVMNALNADKELNEAVSNSNLQLLKTISNRKRNLDNNKEYNSIMDKMIKEEIEIVSDDIKRIEDDLHNKNRMVEVKTYHSNRKNHQLQITKKLIYIVFFMLGISLVYKINLMSETVFVSFITIGLVIFVVYAIKGVYDIMVRDDVTYDEYNYIPPPRYPGKNNTRFMRDTDIPLYEQEDIISNKCYNIMKNNSS